MELENIDELVIFVISELYTWSDKNDKLYIILLARLIN